MIADAEGRLKVRAGLDGEVELRVMIGDRVGRRVLMAVVEGDHELEQLGAKHPSVVEQILVADGEEVKQGQVVLIVREVEEL